MTPAQATDGAAPARMSLPELRDRANDLLRSGKTAEARGLYAAYLAAAPDDAGTLSNVGALLRMQGEHDLSLAAQRRAHRLQPDAPVIRGNLANILNDIGEHEESIALRKGLLGEAVDEANQKALIGKALRAMGRLDEGIAWLRQAWKDHPDYHEIGIQLALTELTAGDYRNGFRNYATRWKTGEVKQRQIPRPLWAGEDLTGKTILVVPEQGFGDAVIFARLLPVLRRFNPARVMFLAEKPLLRLFADLEGVDWIGTEVKGADAFDVWTNLMDLTEAAFAEDAPVPPPTRLAVPPDSTARAARMIHPHRDRFRVGIVWCGSVTYRGNAFRSFSHREFHRLLDLPDLQMFSLYKGPRLDAFHADGSSTLIVDAATHDRDFADCAAVMQAMDLIITSCTATAHIAGSLGVPVWCLLHWDAFWLWKRGTETTEWYPSMTLIRQTRPRDWAGVFDRVHDKLAARIADRRKDRADG